MSNHAHDAIQQLVQMGVQHFCICPGSRSTPLTLAVARHPTAQSHIFHDERSAAFCALGLGKAGQLAALIVTSGTAVANAYPAVIEADAANIPLLLLMADRPPELRASNANQTIDQIKIFGDRVRFFFDFPCASEDYPIQAQRNTISFALSQARGINPGPVHLNWMFREPFEVNPSALTPSNEMRYPAIHTGDLVLTPAQRSQLRDLLMQSQAGLLVVGELTNQQDQETVQEILSAIPWPVILDAASGCRIQPFGDHILAWEDLLRDPPSEFQPDLIVQIGNGLCSKRYEQWLTRRTCPVAVMNSRPISSNPSAAPIYRFQCSVDELLKESEHCSKSDILSLIDRYNKNSRDIILEINQAETINDIQIINTVIQSLPATAQVFIGNSMPIRDINNYLLATQYHRSTSNRGASGIDGIPSTAFGWMLGNDAPTLVILGDLSLMHDWGVLFTLSQYPFRHPFVIVVINNGGGGIFSMLPVSKQHDVFEAHFATAHAHHFAPIIRAMGIACTTVSDLTNFDAQYAEIWATPALHIIEFHTSRENNTRLRQEIQQRVQQGWSQ